MSKSSINNFKFSNIISFGQLINIYGAYSVGGAKTASALTAAALADRILIDQFDVTKNYASLSTFWGYITYKAIAQVQASDQIPAFYKAPLSMVMALSSGGMIYYAHDIFAKQYNILESIKSSAFIANFFDQHDVISGIENRFQQSYIDGTSHAIKNFDKLLSNKFVQFSIVKQAIDLSTLIIEQKLFSNIPDIRTTVLTAEKADVMHKIAEAAISIIGLKIVSIIKNQLNAKLTATIQTSIDKHTAELLLQEDNAQTVMHFADKIQRMPSDLSQVMSIADSGLSNILSSLVKPLLIRNSSSNEQNSTLSTLDNNPVALLTNSIFEVISQSVGDNFFLQFLQDKLYKNLDTQSVGIEYTSMKQGGAIFNMQQNIKSFAYDSIQEIVKCGANIFVLKELCAYLDADYDTQQNYQVSNSIIEFLISVQTIVGDTIRFAGISILGNVTGAELIKVEQGMSALNSLIKPEITYTPANPYAEDSNCDCLESLKQTLSALKDNTPTGADRTLNEGMKLTLRNYALIKGEEKLLDIENLSFEYGKVYAITGKIGTGKTTFLSDIAKCMLPAFSSTGTIEYPSIESVKAKAIFCGSIPISPPGTSLYQKLTYRLPKEEVVDQKDFLMQRAIELFKEFGQVSFDQQKLEIVGQQKLNLSDGQKKLVIIISAILYKEYCDSPVLFVIDETLANLDEHTTSLVCAKIKKCFSDSIVLSVDHNANSNQSFYDKYVDLSAYAPAKNLEPKSTISIESDTENPKSSKEIDSSAYTSNKNLEETSTTSIHTENQVNLSWFDKICTFLGDGIEQFDSNSFEGFNCTNFFDYSD